MGDRKARAWVSGAAGVAVLLLGPAAAAQIPCGYEVTAVIQGPWCGDFYGYPPTRPQDIGENGQIVGYYNHCTLGPSVPFTWTATTGLVALDLPAGFAAGAVKDLDEQTGWLAGAMIPQGGTLTTAVVWMNGVPLDLGTLPAGNYSHAFGAGGGRVVGKWGNNITGPLQAFLWEDGVMMDLGPDLGTPSGVARDVNAEGQVVGWMGTGMVSDARAFIWEEGEVTDLGPIPGGFTSEAWAISSLGSVTGGGRWTDPRTGEPFTRGFVWRNGEMTNLGTLPGFAQSAGLDINDSGTVVGQLWGGPDSAGFVWYEGQMVSLDTLIPPEAGLSVGSAYGINSSGQIAASALDADQDGVGLLLTPIEAPLGDLNCDGSVSEDDFWLLLDAWGACPIEGGCPGDLDGNGAVDVIDFLLMLANWG